MNKKEQDLEDLKEATLVYHKAIETFKKAQPYTKHKAAIQKAAGTTKLLAKSLHLSLTNKPRFQQVVNPNPAPIEQPRTIEADEPEEGIVLADNSDKPKVQQRKRRKRGPNKKKA